MLVYRPKYLWWEGACITIVCLITPLPKAEFYNLPNWIAPLEKGLPFFCWNPFKAHQFIYGSLGHRQVKPGSSQGSSMDARSGAEITYFLFCMLHAKQKYSLNNFCVMFFFICCREVCHRACFHWKQSITKLLWRMELWDLAQRD